jgi:hypothetical protein
MIDPKRFDQPTQDAEDRYGDLLTTLHAVFLASLHEDPTDIRSRATLRSTLTAIADRFLKRESETVRPIYLAFLDYAQVEVSADLAKPLSEGDEVGEAVAEYWPQVEASYYAGIRAQVQRDIEQAMRRWQEFALDYHMKRSRGVPKDQAQAQATDNVRTRATFNFTDRLGRKWSSQVFARTTFRHHLLTLAFEVYTLEAVAMQADHIDVYQADDLSKPVETIAGPEGKTFADIRDSIFHPNSNATLKAVA